MLISIYNILCDDDNDYENDDDADGDYGQTCTASNFRLLHFHTHIDIQNVSAINSATGTKAAIAGKALSHSWRTIYQLSLPFMVTRHSRKTIYFQSIIRLFV